MLAERDVSAERDEDGEGRTMTRAANDPPVTASGMSIARLHARVAVSQSRAGMASRIV